MSCIRILCQISRKNNGQEFVIKGQKEKPFIYIVYSYLIIRLILLISIINLNNLKNHKK